jgi:hypothetical protein
MTERDAWRAHASAVPGEVTLWASQHANSARMTSVMFKISKAKSQPHPGSRTPDPGCRQS